MPLLLRKRLKIGPFILNFTQHGFSSWTFRIGPWSWNSHTRVSRVDLPGPFSWKGRPSRRRTP